MTGPKKFVLGMLVYCATACVAAAAQEAQFLPEVDVHLTVNSHWRVYVQAKDDRDEGASDQFSIGPSVQLYLKPLVKLKDITAFDLDDSKKRAFVLEAGYRSVTAPGKPATNRMETIATFNYPMSGRFLLRDRNRADLDWKGGSFDWRYRNKVTLERSVAIRAYSLIPYVAAEPYYTSQYGKWSTTVLYAGCLLPVGKAVQFNAYYQHENDTGKSPNHHSDSLGLAANFYFALRSAR